MRPSLICCATSRRSMRCCARLRARRSPMPISRRRPRFRKASSSIRSQARMGARQNPIGSPAGLRFRLAPIAQGSASDLRWFGRRCPVSSSARRDERWLALGPKNGPSVAMIKSEPLPDGWSRLYPHRPRSGAQERGTGQTVFGPAFEKTMVQMIPV